LKILVMVSDLVTTCYTKMLGYIISVSGNKFASWF